MITYELAKELKDNGFPQYERKGIGNGDEFIEKAEELIYIPTLSELIEVCGDRFFGLLPPHITNGEWFAIEKLNKIQKIKNAGYIHEFNIYWTGKTPEEAVARLWLALYKKS